MNKLEVNFNSNKISFIIDKYKILFGKNYNLKFMTFQKIKQHLLKKGFSEYEENCNFKSGVFFNDEIIDFKNWEVFDIRSNYSVESELKLGSKSLLLRYFEAKLDSIEYLDETNSIQILINSFIEEVINEKIEAKNFKVKSDDFELSKNNIIKLLSPIFIKDDFLVNQYDLNYNEVVLYQLEIIRELAKFRPDKKHLILFDCPFLTEEIINYLEQSLENEMHLIIYNNFLDNVNVKNFVYFNKKNIDFCDDNVLYEELLMELPFVIDLEELRKKLSFLISGKTDEKLSIIDSFM